MGRKLSDTHIYVHLRTAASTRYWRSGSNATDDGALAPNRLVELRKLSVLNAILVREGPDGWRLLTILPKTRPVIYRLVAGLGWGKQRSRVLDHQAFKSDSARIRTLRKSFGHSFV